MPKSSTPALLPAMVRPFTPLSTSAAIRFSGMPQSPKPPAAMVMSSFSSPARADFASGYTLLISLAPRCGFSRSIERSFGYLDVVRLLVRRIDRGRHALHHRGESHSRRVALVEHLLFGVRNV